MKHWPQTIALCFLVLCPCHLTRAAEDADSLGVRLFKRLAGVGLGLRDPRYTQIATFIKERNLEAAAEIAASDDNFYNVTLFHFFAGKSNRALSKNVPLNDFIAMGIANTLNNLSYTNLLDGDFTATVNAPNLTAPALNNNTHYQQAFDQKINLAQSLRIVTPQRPSFPDSAGVLTSRQFLLEHANMGTNRRIVEFAIQEFLCTPIKKWRDMDETNSDGEVYITRDVNRAPGGDPTAFRQTPGCVHCHNKLDSLRGAFAFHNFTNNAPLYSLGTVVAKMNAINDFPGGFQVTSDEFVNYATKNHNMSFGWRGSLMGNGAKGFGKMLAKAERLSSCAAEQVFFELCKRPPTDSEKKGILADIAIDFEKNNYNLKHLFKKVAVIPQCMGE